MNMKIILKLIKISTFELWKKCKILFFLYFLRTIATALIPLVSVYFIKYITYSLYPSININMAIMYAALMLLIEYILSSIKNIVVFFIEKYNEKIVNDDRYEISTEFLKIFFQKTEDAEFFDNYYKSLDYVNRASVLHIINQMCSIISNLITISGLIFLIQEVSIFALFCCVMIWVVKTTFDNRLNKLRYKMYDQNYNFYRKNDYFIWTLADASYVKENKLYDLKDFLSNKIDIASKNIINKMKQEQNVLFKNGIVQIFLNYILMSIIYLSMIFLYEKQNLEIAQYSMLLSAFFSLANAIYSSINSFLLIKNENLYFEKFKQISSMYISDKKKVTEKCPSKVKTIEFKNVSYCYPNTNKNAIDNLSLKIDLNETRKISLVGVNGSGKTTFIKLLLKLYQPTNGKIFLNGIDISKIETDRYYELFSPVFQDFNIYQCSINENVSFSNESIETELKEVGLYNTIMKLEKKQESNITKIFDQEGVDFSGGEKQKIAIARALKKNSQIIVLDEPTAQLSVESECALYETLKGHKSIVFFISHRLSSCKFTDLILVFENGKIIEKGTHEELMINKKIYYKMFSKQASNYWKEDDGNE